MANSEIFGQRLKNARIMRGYSMDDLCARIGNAVSKMAVSKYESGCMVPNSTIVIKLANALEMPIDYFFRPFQFEISDIQFRKKSRLPVKQEKTIKETVKKAFNETMFLARVAGEYPCFVIDSTYSLSCFSSGCRYFWI